MDNQQETLIINDNYFAGLIDSDFGVYIAKNTYKRKLQLQPRIIFKNTRFELVEECNSKLLNNGINHHVQTNTPTVGKPHKSITIQRLSKCVKFADKWGPFSIVRRPQLELLKDFCLSRIEYVENYGWKYNNTPYTENQKNICNTIYNLNLNYNYDNGYRNYTYSWLAGLIDGDGSIYFCVTKRKCKYKKKNGIIKEYEYDKIFPTIKITTESDTAKNNIMEMYDKLNIRYYEEVITSKASRKLGRHKRKHYYNIIVKEFKDLLLLISKLDGKLIAKQKQLEIMREYINIKMKYNRNTDYLFSLVNKVKKLNNDY